MNAPAELTAAAAPPRWSTWPADRLPERHDAAAIAELAAAYLITPHGYRAGEPVILEPWQYWLLAWVTQRDPIGRRVCRRCLTGLPRKNGKSMLAAVLTLWELATSPLPVEVYGVAGGRDQAGIVLEEVKRFVNLAPRRRDLGLRAMQYAVRQTETGSTYRTLSADAGLAQGLNPHLAIVDEYHVFPSAELVDALELGTSARPDALVWAITTAGHDLTSALGLRFQLCREVAAGDRDVPGLGFAWWAAGDDNADPQNRDEWAAANPNYAAGLKAVDALQLNADTQTRAVFQRYDLNLWAAPDDSWLSAELWEENRDPTALRPGEPTFMRIDFGREYSDAVIVAVQQHPTPTGDEEPRPRYLAAGWLIPAGDRGVPDHEEIMDRLRWARARFRLRSLSYDPRRAETVAAAAQSAGIPTVAVPSTPVRAVPAYGELYKLLSEGRLLHDLAPSLTEQVQAGVARPSGEGFVLVEPGTGASITAARALAFATAEALFGPPPLNIL